ncbi:TlyA family RNA methyltransferase [Azotosporobacter soli]|uniref:TlyA family RNA methyltransferase n=1 Tax=Azotosporobacter soli TaxID=3055040 RepID=UPI0031FE9C11
MEKKRLDVLLHEKNLVPSREKAKAYIMAGKVRVAGRMADKAGMLVDVTADIQVLRDEINYVSRGGLKLEKALDAFSLDLTDIVMFDVGASTGGFTDCALQHNAKRVYAIDVGYGQLAWSLRTDPRVVCMERTNIRHVQPEEMPELADFISIDVAFISLNIVMPAVFRLMKPSAGLVALIKPQFEAGREKVGKKGVVRDPAVHIEVISNVLANAKLLGLQLMGISYSPIKGPEGNIEYLAYWKKETSDQDILLEGSEQEIKAVVNAAHGTL